MKKYKIALLTIMVVLLGSCRKDVPELMNPNQNQLLNTPSQIFESFWHGMNNSYIFWDIDPTDWDYVYDHYLPKFQALDNNEHVSTKELQKLYTNLSETLIDHHLLISINNPQAADGDKPQVSIRPSTARIANRDDYHEPMDILLVLQALQENDNLGRITNSSMGATSEDELALSYLIDNDIAYIYISSFCITEEREKKDPENNNFLKTVDNFKQIILTNKNIKGVVIDVRNNGGGYTRDIEEIFSLMIDKDLQIGSTHSKSGPGRLDFTPWIPTIISPAKIHRKIEVPIVALTNINSVSMSEITALAISLLPNGYIVGERTWGGTGPLFENHNYTYGGAFENKAISVYTSTSLLRDVNGNIFESKGVTPDMEVRYDKAAMQMRNDTQLEAALKFIKSLN